MRRLEVLWPPREPHKKPQVDVFPADVLVSPMFARQRQTDRPDVLFPAHTSARLAHAKECTSSVAVTDEPRSSSQLSLPMHLERLL